MEKADLVVEQAGGGSSIYLMVLSLLFTDHHLRCGGWLNLEFSKRGKTIWDGPLKLFTRSKAEAC